ncbi:ADP-ribosylation factor 1, partial [Tanacetum coccineum]
MHPPHCRRIPTISNVTPPPLLSTHRHYRRCLPSPSPSSPLIQNIRIHGIKNRLYLMNDALIVAKQKDFDVFNALDLIHNETFLKELKYGTGDGVEILLIYNFLKQQKRMGLTFTKLFSALFANREMRISMVGLDAAGKTTILYKLKIGEIMTTYPYNCKSDVRVLCVSQTSQSRILVARARFAHCGDSTFKTQRGLVDSNDRDRVIEARDELHMILNE